MEWKYSYQIHGTSYLRKGKMGIKLEGKGEKRRPSNNRANLKNEFRKMILVIGLLQIWLHHFAFNSKMDDEILISNIEFYTTDLRRPHLNGLSKCDTSDYSIFVAIFIAFLTAWFTVSTVILIRFQTIWAFMEKFPCKCKLCNELPLLFPSILQLESRNKDGMW